MIEYSLLAATMAITAFMILDTFGEEVKNFFQVIQDGIAQISSGL